MVVCLRFSSAKPRMMKTGYLAIHFPLYVNFILTTIDATSPSNCYTDATWDTYFCTDEKQIVDEKTIRITTDGEKSNYLPCLALRKNLKVSSEYHISSQLINFGPPVGERNFGLAFNVKDIKNYDFAYLR